MDESIIPFDQLGYRETERSRINYATTYTSLDDFTSGKLVLVSFNNLLPIVQSWGHRAPYLHYPCSTSQLSLLLHLTTVTLPLLVSNYFTQFPQQAIIHEDNMFVVEMSLNAIIYFA